jgi:uncharacterized protein YfaQ (DUF2300 family)
LLAQDVAWVFDALAAQPGTTFSTHELLTDLGELAPDEGQLQRLRDILTTLQQSGLAESRAS